MIAGLITKFLKFYYLVKEIRHYTRSCFFNIHFNIILSCMYLVCNKTCHEKDILLNTDVMPEKMIMNSWRRITERYSLEQSCS
jgi:hypothetical protein